MLKEKSFLLGLVFGCVASSGIALYAASKNNNEREQKIFLHRSKLMKTVKNITTDFHQLNHQILQISKDGTTIFKDFTKDCKTSFTAWKQDIQPNQEAIKEHVKQMKEGMAQLQALSEK